ncbi:MAG: hypothetical protein F6K08_30710 [Okeania sp. SIO1H6]|nr:hypothetical protein [Okeania sp. SIO1H6]
MSLKAVGRLYQQEQWSGVQSIVIVQRIQHLGNQTTNTLFNTALNKTELS